MTIALSTEQGMLLWLKSSASTAGCHCLVQEGAEGKPRLTETEEALKRFRKRREKMLEPSDVEDEEEEVVVDRAPKRRCMCLPLERAPLCQ